jgi:hypothetical protein
VDRRDIRGFEGLSWTPADGLCSEQRASVRRFLLTIGGSGGSVAASPEKNPVPHRKVGSIARQLQASFSPLRVPSLTSSAGDFRSEHHFSRAFEVQFRCMVPASNGWQPFCRIC